MSLNKLLILFLFWPSLAFAGGGTIPLSHPLMANCSEYFVFDEGTGNSRDLVSGATAQLENGAFWSEVNYPISLWGIGHDGLNDTTEISNAAIHDLPGAGAGSTMAMIFKPNEAAELGTGGDYISTYNPGWTLYWNQRKFDFYDNSAGAVSSANKLDMNAVYLVVFRMIGTKGTIYLYNLSTDTFLEKMAIGAALTVSTNPLRIGDRQDGTQPGSPIIYLLAFFTEAKTDEWNLQFAKWFTRGRGRP